MKKSLLVLVFIFVLYNCALAESVTPKIVIETIFGDIALELYPEDAPLTVANHLQYVEDGFYDSLIFHRAIDDFMIQGGSHEPWAIKRTEGLRPAIEGEFDNGLLNERGTISMALLPGDPNSGTSGFFINQVHNTHLDDKHTVFGKVLSGMDVVDFIAQLPSKVPAPAPGMTDVPIYTDPEGTQYWVYVIRTIMADPEYWVDGDLNNDGIVNMLDYAMAANSNNMSQIKTISDNWLSTAEWYSFD